MGTDAVQVQSTPATTTLGCTLEEKEPEKHLMRGSPQVMAAVKQTQGSEAGLPGKKTKTHQPESKWESGLLSLRLPTNTANLHEPAPLPEETIPPQSNPWLFIPAEVQSSLFLTQAFVDCQETAWLKPAFDVAQHSF